MKPRRFALGFSIAMCAGALPLSAQNPDFIVYYDHGPPKEGSARVHYGPSRNSGLPNAQLVPQFTNGCFQIERANPLLYNYSLDVAAISPTKSADNTLLTDALDALLGSALVTKATDTEMTIEALSPNALVKYKDALSELNKNVQRFDNLRWRSDQQPDFVKFVDGEVREVGALVAKANMRADSAFDEGEKLNSLKDIFDILRIAQQAIFSRYSKSNVEFIAAKSQLGSNGVLELCKRVSKDGAKFKLLIKPAVTFPAGTIQDRPSEDGLTSFELDSYAISYFDVLPMVTFSFGASGARDFKIAEGVIRGGDSKKTSVNAGLLGLGRLGMSSPVWAAAGVTKGSKNVDLLLGLAFRGGNSWVGEIIVGGGWAYAWVPDGLNGDAAEGKPLPATVKNLNDVVHLGQHSAGAVFFSMSGLSIGGSKKAGGGSDTIGGKAPNDKKKGS